MVVLVLLKEIRARMDCGSTRDSVEKISFALVQSDPARHSLIIYLTLPN